MSASDHNLTVALRLAAGGLHVFPTGPDKRPLIRDWDELSSCDPDQIRRWWRIRRQALVAIDLRKAGLVVIDADRHGGPDGVAEWLALVRQHDADLTGCPTAWTPRRGLHVYFSQPDGDQLGNRCGSLPDGVEVKGQGGNITAPYCIRHDGTFYELTKHSPDLAEAFTAGAIPHVPDWLVEIIRKPRHGAPPAAWEPCRRNGDRYAAYAQAALRGIVTELSSLPSGGRNNALNAAAFRLGRMVARGWIDRREIREALTLAAHANGLLAEDGPPAVDATIQSGLSAGLAKPADEPRARK